MSNEHPRAAAERRIVAQLGEAMLRKLAQRREHGEWHADYPESLLAQAKVETRELCQALDDYTSGTGTRGAVIAEAADVANYLAMMVDVLSRETM